MNNEERIELHEGISTSVEYKGKKVVVTMHPCYEAEEFIRRLEEVKGAACEVGEALIAQVWRELADGFCLNPKFASEEEMQELKKHIPARYLTPESRKQFLHKYRKNSPIAWNLYIFAALWNYSMKLEPITLYMDDNQDRELFEEYMKDNGYVLHPGDYTVNLALVMWGVRIEHSKDCKQEESALFPGEKVILDSKNPELCRLAIKAGFLYSEHVWHYVKYVLDMPRKNYNVLLPVLLAI